ncbi:Malonyl-CoA-acyl carrier protein transacylase, mitochondrial [Symbiodinium microadriaticum]|uniref:Malonyl-CoA-acyl carrier protein transacylase, mitochondrial n=1 Tax=Symbiodinium microadriaticum TaxID=2951 RepID=A0A1Q9CX62_SYMMI|nr:Malonyl-CoA-acyl carrier protein transacylase, mitochondrial [Symbiodinium microadriaticum]
MPYLEDGETWSADYDVAEHGMAENRPGHRKFSSYRLPTWAKHPLTHPFNGIVTGPKDYMYAAGDGFVNPLGWSDAHIACKYGDVTMLERSTPEALSRPTSMGDLPAHYAVMYGMPWCLAKLVELGADTMTPNNAGDTPETKIWRRRESLQGGRQHAGFDVADEGETCYYAGIALKGELSEKNSVKAQEYHLVKHRAMGNDPVVTERLDKDLLKARKYKFGLGEYVKPYEVPEHIKQRPLDLPLSKVEVPVKQEPPLPVALLFPGQGSQYVGMLKDVMGRPSVKGLLDRAQTILGWDPRDLCLNGPAEKLEETQYCQPIMFLAGLAAVEVLRESRPDVVDRCFCMAGLSLGEYTAVTAAGVLSFEDGLKLVQLRAEAMQEASKRTPQAMCSVAGLDRAKVANFLFPSGFTCAGTKNAIDDLCKRATAARALQARPIKTSGAFHTPLMSPAQEQLSRALDAAAQCSLYFNVSGKRVKEGSDPASFLELMKMQLTNEVLWEPTIKAMIMDGVKDFFEVGPLKQLKSMLKRIDADAFKRTENVSV